MEGRSINLRKNDDGKKTKERGKKMDIDRCIMCGGYVPEGRAVCSKCEKKSMEMPIKKKTEMSEQEFYTKLGAEIRKARERRFLTQEEVADRCGFCRKSISKWEKGLSSIRVHDLYKIACAIGTEVKEMMGD